jgi:uncharacterized protein YacL
MEGLLDQIGQLLRGIFALAEGGFDGVNQVLGLIIAAVAAVLMASWGRLFPTALAAAVIHVIIAVFFFLKSLVFGRRHAHAH